MRNWSTDTRSLKGEAYAMWRMEQLINFGLGGERIDRSLLEAYLPKIQIDPSRRAFLELLLDESSNSH